MAALERSILPLDPARSALLDCDFGSDFPPADPSQGIVAGCTWPGYIEAHLAAQRNKMKALLQELGVRVRTANIKAADPPPDHPTPQVPAAPQACPTAQASHKRTHADAIQEPSQADSVGPSSSQGPQADSGSHKRPHEAAVELSVQVTLPVIIDSSSSSDTAKDEVPSVSPLYSPGESGGTNSPEIPANATAWEGKGDPNSPEWSPCDAVFSSASL